MIIFHDKHSNVTSYYSPAGHHFFYSEVDRGKGKKLFVFHFNHSHEDETKQGTYCHSTVQILGIYLYEKSL